MAEKPVVDGAIANFPCQTAFDRMRAVAVVYCEAKMDFRRGMGVHTLMAIRKIDFLRRSMVHAAQRHGTFAHPEVLQISRDLDECILAVQRGQGRQGERILMAASSTA